MDATAVYLDSNQMSELGPEIFLGRSRVRRLLLNSSQITGGLIKLWSNGAMEQWSNGAMEQWSMAEIKTC